MEFEQILKNEILGVSILAWFIAQVIKIVIEFMKVKKVNLGLIMSSGGMPSSHTSFVTSLATSVGISEGFNSTIFAMSFVLAGVVMYDATNVRLEAGKQAKVINDLLDNLKDHEVKLEEKLEELLGHTPIQVFAGLILGTTVSIGHFY